MFGGRGIEKNAGPQEKRTAVKKRLRHHESTLCPCGCGWPAKWKRLASVAPSIITAATTPPHRCPNCGRTMPCAEHGRQRKSKALVGARVTATIDGGGGKAD